MLKTQFSIMQRLFSYNSTFFFLLICTLLSHTVWFFFFFCGLCILNQNVHYVHFLRKCTCKQDRVLKIWFVLLILQSSEVMMAWGRVFCRPNTISILHSYNRDCSPAAVTAEALHNKSCWCYTCVLSWMERPIMSTYWLKGKGVWKKKKFNIEYCLNVTMRPFFYNFFVLFWVLVWGNKFNTEDILKNIPLYVMV